MKRNNIPFLLIAASGIAAIGYVAATSDNYRPVIFAIVLMLILLILLSKDSFRYFSFRNKEEIPLALNEQLVKSIKQLEELRGQLIIQEKMASIGMLTAGIAHEIKNPLNFINNFSDMTVEMLQELKVEIARLPDSTPKESIDSINVIIDDVATNCKKINEHGKRAESIIKNMLIQSRSVEGEKTPCNINSLLDEYLNLAYHGMRAQNNKFNVKIERNFDSTLPNIIVSAQSMGRVFLNIINNGLYAVNEKAEMLTDAHTAYMPTITVTTTQNENDIIIKIRDNGDGIPESLQKKIFEPFFTTKPIGKGTGLGLPICYDIIVKEHSGKLDILSVPKEFTEFVLTIPKDKKS